MHSFQGQTVGDCVALGAGRGRFTHICVGSTAGRMSGELALGAPPADCPGSLMSQRSLVSRLLFSLSLSLSSRFLCCL